MSVRNPNSVKEFVIPVGENDRVHQRFSSHGSFDWKIERRKEIDIVGRIHGLDDRDLKQIWSNRTHKTFAGYDSAEKYPIHSFTDYEQTQYSCTFSSWKSPRQHSKLAAILDIVAFEEKQTNVQMQEPGEITPLHTDQLTVKRGEEDYGDPRSHRILVFLTNWSFGQVFQYGNETLTHWRSGDVVVMLNKDVPHGGANFGMVPRIILQVTGIPTNTTFKNFPRFREIDQGKIPIEPIREFKI